MLQRLAAHLGVLPKDVTSVALSCHHCKLVQAYALPAIDARISPVKGLSWFWRELPCGEKGCQSPLTVIAVRNATTMTEEECDKDFATWEWGDELRCPHGHPIAQANTRRYL